MRWMFSPLDISIWKYKYGSLNGICSIQQRSQVVLLAIVLLVKRIVAGTSILTQFELALIIVIGLIIPLIFASNSIRPKRLQKHKLN